MYFKVSIRVNPATDHPDGYYRLVESYRNFDGRVCHRTMLHIGFMTGARAEDLNRIQKLINHKCQFPDNELFRVEYEKEPPFVQKWFTELYARLINEKKIDVSDSRPSSCRVPAEKRDWHTIDINSFRHKDVREIGGEWLCYGW
jgi:hypothetical protein